MADWSPKYAGGLAGMASVSSKSPGVPEVPETEVPAIGDTVRIVATPYNHYMLTAGQNVPDGAKVVELEVKAIKTAKVIFE